jgi:arylsulfatase A-like enzyme
LKRALAVAMLCLAACKGPAARPAATPAASPSPVAGNPLNVLLITIDTLRADHLGAYGYARATSPHIDALAARGALFARAYTYWPKTRGSFVMMMTGRRPSQNGYGKSHPVLVDFNPTLAGAMQAAGYDTAAVVDNPNVAAQHGYAKGFARYRETWEEKALGDEVGRARAITEDGIAFLRASRSRPFFLWLHYVSPHAPYAPPPPYDRAFLDAGELRRSRRLPVVPGLHGGIPKQWAVPGQDRLAYYVAQYDGEIAFVDAEVGRVLEALDTGGAAARTLVVLTSDHGESLGEHDYFFDHGEDLFDPSLEIPLLVALPGAREGVRSTALASTLDVLPTILDALKVSYPPDLAGRSLLPEVTGRSGGGAEWLTAQNERNLSAAFDARYKVVAAPRDDGSAALSLFDRDRDPAETRDVARTQADALRLGRRQLELAQEQSDREWSRTRPLLAGAKGEQRATPEACEQLRALNYVATCP